LRAVALAQRHEVELAAVPADVAVRVEPLALSEIADRPDSSGSLAWSSATLIHRRGVLVLFAGATVIGRCRPGCQGARARGTQVSGLTAELLGEVIEELEVYRARAERIGVEPS
jgi:hypothetical protein